jgi:hypothetical protein
MKCTFDISTCSPDCPKFSFCTYSSIQNQLSEINSQLNFVLNILTQISCESGIQKERLNIAEANINDIVSTLIELTNDSETIQTTKGVRTNEEIN